MNLKIRTSVFELELTNTDVTRIEKTLMAAFAFINGESFSDAYFETPAEERPVNSKRNYIEAINGVREHANGTKEYRCTYSCSCGNSGTRYIHEDAETTTCHKCRSELAVFPAADNEAHDEECNYFLAY